MSELTEHQKFVLLANLHIPTNEVIHDIEDTQAEIQQRKLEIAERERFIIQLESLLHIRRVSSGQQIEE